MLTEPHSASTETPTATPQTSSVTIQEAIDNAILRALQTTTFLDEARKVDFDAIRRPLGMRI